MECAFHSFPESSNFSENQWIRHLMILSHFLLFLSLQLYLSDLTSKGHSLAGN